ncbi:Alpha-fimbriae usher protein [Enterobacter hormaechei]|uniref:TcfC E-set like domain-containing protein n=1 Tax=Enterobacter hormaechei TaxID=158836 RepID=UPI0007937120|nr:TcfC E-set like domain-containing protein [Enterobacter hormaechei]SAG82448.1 Alpha-fimbriae usher protein [Enterobacter hormaechei]
MNKLPLWVIFFPFVVIIPEVPHATMRVPAGFEELVQGQEFQSEVQVYGQSLGMARIRVDLENITFLEPDKLSLAIAKLYGNPSGLDSLLKKNLHLPMNRNSQLSCSAHRGRIGCDYLKTDSLGVIYDENNNVVSLFLSDRYTFHVPEDSGYYQAAPAGRNAFIHQQALNLVTTGQYQSLALRGNGTLGLGDASYASVDWSWLSQRSGHSSNQEAETSNAYFRQDFMKRIYIQTGLMNSQDIYTNAGGNIALNQLPIGRIRGIRMGSTLAWVNKSKMSAGTPVNLFLPRDARVDAYRDNQLLNTFYLKAGMQLLDTSMLPAGSYTLTLRIYENNQLVRTESQLYARQEMGWGNGFQWFLQLGSPDSERSSMATNASHEHFVMHAGGRLPLTETLALTAGTAVLSDSEYVETAADWLHGFDSGVLDGQLSSRVSWLQGSDGSQGNTQQVSYNDGFALSFYRTSRTADDCNVERSHIYGFTGCYKNTSLLLSVPVMSWQASVGYAISDNQGRYAYRQDLDENSAEYNAGGPWEQVYRSSSRSESWQLGLNRSFAVNGLNINTRLSAYVSNVSTYRSPDKGGYIGLSISRSTKLSDGARRTTNAGVDWQSGRSGGRQFGYSTSMTQYDADNGNNYAGVALSGINTDTVNGSVTGSTGGQYGDGTLTISDTWDRSGSRRHTFGSSGAYTSSLVADRSGVALGRWSNDGTASAFSVSVGQSDGETGSRVSISGLGRRTDISSGRRAVFTTQGYQKSTFSINESGVSSDGVAAEITKGTGTTTAFMVPGKILNKEVIVSPRYIWLGRLLDGSHQPIEGAIPLNVASWTSIGDGGFTMETESRMDQLYVMRADQFWVCVLRVQKMRDVIRYLGTTTCQNTDIARLPSAERRQVTLMTARS